MADKQQDQLEILAGLTQISVDTNQRAGMNSQWLQLHDQRLREVWFMLAELLTPEQQQRATQRAEDATKALYDNAKTRTEFNRLVEDIDLEDQENQ